jgi:uncharacterized membrane protein
MERLADDCLQERLDQVSALMRRWLFYGLIILFSVIWSSAFIAGKVAITELDPFAALTLRFLLSVALLLTFYVRQSEHFRNRQTMRAGIQLLMRSWERIAARMVVKKGAVLTALPIASSKVDGSDGKGIAVGLLITMSARNGENDDTRVEKRKPQARDGENWRRRSRYAP